MKWTRQKIPRNRLLLIGLWLLCFAALLTGCQHVSELSENNNTLKQPSQRGVQILERDIETPEVFETTEAALWDGHPTLGGVWVAHPAVKVPMRVIVRNPATHTFIIGNLFRNDPAPGKPQIRVSADAARALELSAGKVTRLHVTALQREAVSTTSKTSTLSYTSIDAPPSALLQMDILKEPVKSLSKAYLQIGLFRIKANAIDSVGVLRAAGVQTKVKQSRRKGKLFWRVLAGPCKSIEARNILLKLVRSKGFTDAYAVAN